LRDERPQPARDQVASLLSEAEEVRTRLLTSAIDVGEVNYLLRKRHTEALAESWRESSRTLPVTIETPSADDIWSAASLKARCPIAYADAFAAALAQKYNCPLVTGDPEFRRMDQLELDWIGSGEAPNQAGWPHSFGVRYRVVIGMSDMPNPRYDQARRSVQALGPAGQLRLIAKLVGQLSGNMEHLPHRSLLELQGLGKDVWQGVDMEEHVRGERSSWGG